MGYVFEDDNDSNLILSRIFAHWAQDCSQLLSWYSTIPISKEYIIYDMILNHTKYVTLNCSIPPILNPSPSLKI